jgi:hypothetical protein
MVTKSKPRQTSRYNRSLGKLRPDGQDQYIFPCPVFLSKSVKNHCENKNFRETRFVFEPRDRRCHIVMIAKFLNENQFIIIQQQKCKKGKEKCDRS